MSNKSYRDTHCFAYKICAYSCHGRVIRHALRAVSSHACPCHHLFTCFPAEGHKYTLYNCVNITELKDEVDQNSSTECTSALQTWHKPRVEGISPYLVMEIAVFKTRLQDHKSCGIACQLYEARKVNRKSKLQEFVSSVQSIDSN